ncbi:carbamoyltransferase [Planctomycetota bacterium]
MTRSGVPLVLGINAAYHESSAALVRGGEVLCALEEERLSRTKHAKTARIDNPHHLPWGAIDVVLREAGVGPADLDAVAYSLVPGRRLRNVGLDPQDALSEAQGWGTGEGEARFEACLRTVPALLEERRSVPRERFHFVPHHLSHAASVFYCSEFYEAAVLVLDGIGEDSAGWLGVGRGSSLECLQEIPYPHSLGLLWERFALYLGFSDHAAAKVMGLAAYGRPDTYADPMAALLAVSEDPESPRPFTVSSQLARLRAPDVAGLESLFGPRREAPEPITAPRFAAVASALQHATDRAVLATAQRLVALSSQKNLCYSGGVALNCVSNAALEMNGPFERIEIIGAAHDGGTAVGAALAVALAEDPTLRCTDGTGLRVDLGPAITESEAVAALKKARLSFQRVTDPARAAAEAVAKGLIVGWAQGRLELGPRALGRRSVLADPRDQAIRARLNDVVKKREAYRPFGASVLEEELAAWFGLSGTGACTEGTRSRMLLAYPVREDRRTAVPAVVHADGTCRINTVSRERDGPYYDLISHFAELTGVPLLLNTSFNDREPIVCTADDAVKTAVSAGMDMVVVDRLVARL